MNMADLSDALGLATENDSALSGDTWQTTPLSILLEGDDVVNYK